MGQAINYIDFELEIIVDLTNPGVTESYSAYNKLSEKLSKKPIFDTTEEEVNRLHDLKEKFIQAAYASNAVTKLT